MSVQNKKCFIITPIGPDLSDTRRAADGVIESVIVPVLENLGYCDIKAAHHISIPGSINNQVIERIVNDDLVIANLTGLNPNVMYELAVRHATMKPIIHICEFNTQLPFDIKDQRTILYVNDMKGVKELERKLEDMVNQVQQKDLWEDNPVYNAIKEKIFYDHINEKPNEKEFEKFIIKKLESIERIINNPQVDKIYADNISNVPNPRARTIKIVTDSSIDEGEIIDDIKNCFDFQFKVIEKVGVTECDGKKVFKLTLLLPKDISTSYLINKVDKSKSLNYSIAASYTQYRDII